MTLLSPLPFHLHEAKESYLDNLKTPFGLNSSVSIDPCTLHISPCYIAIRVVSRFLLLPHHHLHPLSRRRVRLLLNSLNFSSHSISYRASLLLLSLASTSTSISSLTVLLKTFFLPAGRRYVPGCTTRILPHHRREEFSCLVVLVIDDKFLVAEQPNFDVVLAPSRRGPSSGPGGICLPLMRSRECPPPSSMLAVCPSLNSLSGCLVKYEFKCGSPCVTSKSGHYCRATRVRRTPSPRACRC